MSSTSDRTDPAGPAGPLLEIADLEVCFASRERTVRAVNGLSLTVRRGEILGLVGESGSGKSVTALAVLGLIRPPGISLGCG
jgi:peptide/nickel transport system ATP-binding protein